MNLYDTEENLRLLIEACDEVNPEQLAELETDITAALRRSREKRDAVGHYRQHLESQFQLCKAEIARLQDRKQAFESQLDALDRYILSVMDITGVRSLEGNTLTLIAKKNPDKVEITDAISLPDTFQKVTIEMGLHWWNTLLGFLTPDQVETVTATISKFQIAPRLNDIRAAIKISSSLVPGATLSPNGNHLEIK